MDYAMPQTLTSASPDAAMPSARHHLDGAELQGISQRFDLRGAIQLGAHGTCMAATTLLVWVAQPFWYLLLPAMVA